MADLVNYQVARLTTSGTARSITLSPAPTPGNRLVVVLLADKLKTITNPAGFTPIGTSPNDETSISDSAVTRIVQAGDSATVTFTLNTSTQSACDIIAWEISGDTTIGGYSRGYTGETPTNPQISTGNTGALPSSNGIGLAITGVDSVSAWADGSAHAFSNGYTLEEIEYTDPVGNSGIPGYAVGHKFGSLNTAGEETTFAYTEGATQEDQMVALLIIVNDAATAATLSTPTPSGTLTTQGQATLGATTTQASGNVYGVITATSSDLTGITASEIIAGQIAGGGAAPFSGSAAVSTLTPSVTITGLTAATTYYYAFAQSNGNGASNIVTGSFTTAAASRGVQVTLKSRTTGLLTGLTVRVQTRYEIGGAVIDGGSSGTEFATNGSGVLSCYGLTINAGPGVLTIIDPNDSTRSINVPVTFAAAL